MWVFVLPGIKFHCAIFASNDSLPCFGLELKAGRSIVTLALIVAHGISVLISESLNCDNDVGSVVYSSSLVA